MWRTVMENAKVWFRNWHDKKITLMLIGTGCSAILAGFSSPIWLVPLIQLFNEKLETNIPVPNSDVDYIVMVTSVAVGLLLVILGIKYRKWSNFKNKKMVQIRHSSIEGNTYNSVRANLDDYDVIPITINQFQDLEKIDEFNLKMAWKKQDQTINDLLVYINDPTINEIAYMGMAHIPFQFLLGYQIADKTDVRFFEWNRTEKSWVPLTVEDESFPKLVLHKDESKQTPNDVEELVIKVGITFEIFDWQLEGHDLENLNSFYFKLEPPRLDAVTSIKQLNHYKQEFRSLLTEIHHKYQKLKKVHIFLSAQPSVAFSFGSSISARMDSNKEFWIYNYVGSSTVKYPWGIKLSKDKENGEIKIL
ncbi:SAVED domain-containing protein [Sutcliffiella sp. NC1]|uniref:SAVED domain-containing protein n=1 Tax=Sutcliffiella sp. NC1 TaxID=3004096 RepID=UPI0022DD2957|nr:SAVED domain-containing protein [Sutcliffiella sp. NC1]WBL15226.1 SAVED domain-containing protein [Sutcliffiella sp. NC1]